MRDHPRADDQQEGERPRVPDPASQREARWARMSGRDRVQFLLDMQNPPKPDGRANDERPSDRQRVPTNIQRLLDLPGPRSADKPVPTGWDAPGVKDHPKRPVPEKIRLPDDRRSHILGGDATGGGHRYGTGRPGKTEFPERWDDSTASEHILNVGRHPASVKLQDNGRWKVTGNRDRVELSVVVEPDGQVWTAYPKAGGDGVMKNPKRQGNTNG